MRSFAPKHPRFQGSLSQRLAWLCAGTLLVWSVLPGVESVRAGDASFSSHLLAPDASWQALSGANAPLGEGLSGVRGNPAGLGAMDGVRSAASHLMWAGDLAREWVAVGGPVSSRLGAWADVSVLHGPALPGYDESGVSTGTFAPVEWAAGGAVSVSATADLHVGLGARYFRLEDPSEPVSGVGVSTGVRFDWGSRAIGLSVSDVGTARAGDHGDYSLPTTWRAGALQLLEGIGTMYAGAYHQEGSGWGGVFGVTVYATPWASLHGGADWADDPVDSALGWSSGVSLTRDRLTLSYAYRSIDVLASAHQFGLELPIGPPRSE